MFMKRRLSMLSDIVTNENCNANNDLSSTNANNFGLRNVARLCNRDGILKKKWNTLQFYRFA